MKAAFPGFSQGAMEFFGELERNNVREWFHPRKQEFENLVREPMLELAAALNDALARFAPEYVTDPKKAVMRIYRDTRFSANKTPYKSHIAASFPRHGLEESGGTGFYFSVNHKVVEIAGGIYHPPREILLAVRSHIAETQDEFRKLLADRRLRKLMGGLQGGELSRAPKGFSPDHVAIDLIRKKGWVFFVELDAAVATSAKLFREIESRFEVVAPVLEYLNRPLLAQKSSKAKMDRMTRF